MTADSDGNIMEKQEKRTEADTPWTPCGHQNGHPVDTETDTKADRQKGAERGCRRDCL